MRLLLIYPDNFAIEPLQALCAKHDVKSCAMSAFAAEKLADTANYDVVILAGTNAALTAADEALVGACRQWATPGGTPVAGLGWGFGIVCAALGEAMQSAERGEAAAVLRPTEDGTRLFQGSEPMKVQANERWYLEQFDSIRGQVTPLAVSESGIEAIKHKKLPLYAVQQLPADFVYASDGALVLANIISVVGKH